MLNHIQAEDEIKTHFNERWNDWITNGLPSMGIPALELKKRDSNDIYIPKIFWQNVEQKDLNDNGVHWCRFMNENVITEQSALTGGLVDEVGTRYTTQGILIVQMFFSKSAYQDVDAKRLETIAWRSFVKYSTPGNVWFRKPLIVQLSPEENFFRTNVTAQYQYDTRI